MLEQVWVVRLSNRLITGDEGMIELQIFINLQNGMQLNLAS